MTVATNPRPSPNKKQVIAQLKEATRLLELLGDDPFKAKAFASALRSLESYEGDFSRLFEEGRLTELRGVGKSLAAELAALGERERLPVLDALYDKIPESVRELFVVSGLGPKKIASLWDAAIVDLETLAAACEDGRLTAVKGFSLKTAGSLKEAARFALASRGRMRLDVAEVYAELLRLALKEAAPEGRVEPAGELRRRMETVAELELVVAGVGPQAIRSALAPLLTELSEEDGWRGRFQGKAVTVTVAPPEAFGAVLAVRTGGADFVEALRLRAEERGYALSARGLYREGTLVATLEESELFARLDLPRPPPERREEARPERVDGLLSEGDLRGLVHNHSSWSDGANSLREMVAGARLRGARYLAMADHSRSSHVANGLSLERLRAQGREIAAIRAELVAEGVDFGLLHGVEVDILPDGNLDYPDEVLAELDYTVVSVHSHFNLSEAAQTARLVRAVSNPHAGILGHASGRLLLRRPSYAVDLGAVIEACALTGTVIEINASPYRLDLDWRWVKRAKEKGCRFSINPDAHVLEGFDGVRYGVMMARKAGLTPDEVVNTAPSADAFLLRLKPRRVHHDDHR
jgi:DNA polymerase (family 10)